GVAAELAAAVSQHAQELDIVLLEERQHPVIEQIGRRDGRLQHRLLAADFLQGQFAALVVQLLESVEAVATEPIILQAWMMLPSCLASSSRPTLARMIFCSVVMVSSNAPRGQDTSVRLNFS